MILAVPVKECFTSGNIHSKALWPGSHITTHPIQTSSKACQLPQCWHNRELMKQNSLRCLPNCQHPCLETDAPLPKDSKSTNDLCLIADTALTQSLGMAPTAPAQTGPSGAYMR